MKSSLPLRDGVGASSVQLPRGPWTTVLEFLEARFPEISLAEWWSRFERGLVVGDDGAPIATNSVYVEGLNVHYYRELAEETAIPFQAEVLYQDEHLLVADKPHFLPVMPAGRFLQQTLLVRLKREFGLDHLVPLHRIDRGTAGVVVFSKNPQTRGAYQTLFPRREVEKFYEALAPALPDVKFPLTRHSHIGEGEPFFRMCEMDAAANSETHIDVIATRGALSLYGLRPITGRKHQLRVHLAALGAAIVNDDFYPTLREEAEDDFSRPLKLLARAIEFDDPITGQHRRFESRRSL
ncbi:pseudouridine synthase [Stenotrophobium rhamnosiphilum]|uniref:Pseudouridine synthase n=1 Tax=Stenotrophobium rhamnosiphilum TaxID=2029166 RepID=A0A2T5MCI3_9GAMM|nr:pseudouridine synthase [Stenotrophobium rhamnosiphilum]PTU30267.1 pseudouridine synthase [Stenotrophobium rhamnosiphilum]